MDKNSADVARERVVETGDSERASSTPRSLIWWRLVRGGNVLLAGIASAVGVWLSGGEILSVTMLLAILSPTLILAAGNIDNDICDLEIDRRFKPDRPLVSGAIPVDRAATVCWSLTTAGLALALVAGVEPFGVAAGVVFLLAIYNRILSGLPLVGNVAVAAMGALPIAYGGICVGRGDLGQWGVAAVGAVIAFWLHLAREILKDVEDVTGDKVIGRDTLPIALTPQAAIRLAALPMLLAAAFALWLGRSDWLTVLYLFGISVTVIPALLLGAAQCLFNPQPAVAARWSTGLKLIMAGGLLWMVLGR